MILKEIKEVVIRIIQDELIWYKHYIGKVLNLNDPKKKGRILVGILDLGCFTADIGFWCWPRDKNGIITPKVNDWVEVYFMNGNRDMPVYLGIASEMANMLPKNYDGKSTTQIIFESNNKNFFVKYDEEKIKISIEHKKFHINYDGNKDELEIGSNTFLSAARKGDKIKSNSVLDNAFFTFLSTHTHSGVTTGPGISGPPSTPPAPTSLDGDIDEGSEQVKIGDK